MDLYYSIFEIIYLENWKNCVYLTTHIEILLNYLILFIMESLIIRLISDSFGTPNKVTNKIIKVILIFFVNIV